MEFLVNDRSIHQQFQDLSTFRDAVGRLMAMRNSARDFGLDVYCHRALPGVEPIPGVWMQQAVQGLAVNQRRALMSWLTQHGPFWDDIRRHEANDWLECRGDVVTDSAIGEAAYRTMHGVECALISATPSDWDYSPVEVVWRPEKEGLDDRNASLDNWRDDAALNDWLQDASPPIRSWDELGELSRIRFKRLTFADPCFEPLAGVPFARSAAARMVFLLSVLDSFASEFDAIGARTPEGNRIYREYFSGAESAFSDSSDTEKQRFRARLMFPHPDRSGESLFCTWHGKVRHMALRLHFSWPVRADESVYVVYAGPKLTKR